MEALILCGGQGTRLRSAVWEVPKCLAPIHGRPFLEYLLLTLSDRGITKFILCTGYKKGLVREAMRDSRYDIEFSEEDIPLGTGGAVKKALSKCKDKEVFVVNGDTLFDIDLHVMMESHLSMGKSVTAAIKQYLKPFCFINGGIYVINKSLGRALKYNTSFEDVLVKHQPGIVVWQEYFIDIGTPGDYERAQREFLNIE